VVYRFFEKLAVWTTQWTGSTKAFITALAVIVLWVICGPLFNYCDTWQLVINTSTTIVTFMMVFLLQRAHNKESLAIQIKLNELIASQSGASNKLINIEHLTEDEIKEIHMLFDKLAQMAHEDSDPLKSQSVENFKK
jgi:low affinity Fe/Cu permease